MPLPEGLDPSDGAIIIGASLGGKDPSQNITWTTPEGGGGPNYPNM
jgi:hypothetical protein